MTDELTQILDELQTSTKGLYTEQKEKMQRISTRMDDIQAEMGRPDLPGRKAIGGIAGYVTPGQRVIEQKGLLEDFRRNGRVRLDIGGLWPALEGKSLIDSTALGWSTPGALGSTRIEDGVVPAARRRLTIRDLLRSKPVETAQIDFLKENSFTNAASPQAEGSTKGESTLSIVPSSERIRTIAHFLNVSKQAVWDLPELRRFIDETMIYGLKLKEEAEILAGDDLGEHYNGLITQATSYQGTYNVAGDTRLDRLNWAILELAVANEQTTGIVLNPVDYHRILAIKADTNGANTGAYVVVPRPARGRASGSDPVGAAGGAYK